MTTGIATFALTLLGTWAGSAVLDGLVRPRGIRRVRGLWLLACMAGAVHGLFLMLCGNPAVAMVLALAVQALLVVASNAKHAMLGEPLLFSDLALVGAVFRHPQFYLSAVRLWQRVAAALVAAVLLGVVGWLSRADPEAHLAGLLVLAAALAALALSLPRSPRSTVAKVPDAQADTGRFGLLPTVLLYWRRWRAQPDPAPCPQPHRRAPDEAPELVPELVVAIQCESFADPTELFGDPALALPGLQAAQTHAMQWGNLEVSGFGAYTMRTEYGVLFGRDEAALGFRLYDPFLTAAGEGTYALPSRLPGWQALFVHPHDMRFYGRDAIMPAGGFAELVGEDHFASPGAGEGRYVTDAAMTEVILARAKAATQPSIIYAVTIENHGPWAPDARGGGSPDLVAGYMRLVRRGDAMLEALTAGLAALGRPALLVFFGDHRPSIPGASVPGGPRHTPYVMVRMDGRGGVMPGDNRRVDLSPAQLHHTVLDTVLGPVAAPQVNPFREA